MRDPLDVYLHGEHVGAIEDAGMGTYGFSYDGGVSERHQLSASLPINRQSFTYFESRPFFEGLLPEERVRQDVARQLAIESVDSFGLMAAIGGECAGAVSILPTDEAPGSDGGVRWLTPGELGQHIDALPSFPLGRDQDARSRASLAGARRKMVAVVDGGDVGLPRGATPSTYILKPEWRPGPDDPQIVDMVSNEAFCMRLAAAVELRVAAVQPKTVGGRSVLFVERFDRVRDREGAVARVHQEDLAQAAGKTPASKYEEDGGISLAEVASTYRAAGVAGIVAGRHLLDAIVFAAATGNADQHAKNLAVLYGRSIDPAPLYDLVSTLVYEELSPRSAFRIGDEVYIDEVGGSACVKAAAAFGMPEHRAARRVSELTTLLHDRVPAVLEDADREGWLTPTAARVADLVRTWPERADRH